MRALTYGLAGGGAVVTTMALVYGYRAEVFLSPLFQWSLLVLYAVTMLLAAARRPPLPKSAAIRSALVAYLCVSACYYLYTYLLYEAFDPELYAAQSELMIANARAYGLQTPGTQTLEELYAPETFRYTLTGVLQSYAWGAIFAAAAAFLIGTLLGVDPSDVTRSTP